MSDAPKRIWLQVDPEGERYDDPLGSDWDGVTWCQDQMNTTDVEYVRSDEIERLEAENARLEAIVAEVPDELLEFIAAGYSEEAAQLAKSMARRALEQNDD